MDTEDQERQLLEIIDMMQREHRRQLEPYIKTLVHIQSMRPQPRLILPAELVASIPWPPLPKACPPDHQP